MPFHKLKSLWRQRTEPVRAAVAARAPLFDPEACDNAMYQRKLAKRPAARTRYVMHFTPRSGSSWLTDLAEQTGRLGKPGECFNPNFLPRMAARLDAANMDEFVEVMAHHWNRGDVFGCQLTHYHMRRCFGGPEAFMKYFADVPCFWLIREDIVLQAVSLMKMVQTKVKHSVLADADARAAADAAFVYDAERIAHYVTHIFEAEQGSEALFARYDLSPLRLSYEHDITMGADQMVNVIAHHIGVPPIPAGTVQSGHQRLGTDRNAEFADRFRAEKANMLARIDAARAQRLALIDRTLPDRLPAEYRSG